jgi:hypothetical protein
MLESTDGERLPWFGMLSGGKEVCRSCDGPAVDGFRRLLAPGGPIEERFRGIMRLDSGGEPAGGEVAMLEVDGWESDVKLLGRRSWEVAKSMSMLDERVQGPGWNVRRAYNNSALPRMESVS